MCNLDWAKAVTEMRLVTIVDTNNLLVRFTIIISPFTSRFQKTAQIYNKANIIGHINEVKWKYLDIKQTLLQLKKFPAVCLFSLLKIKGIVFLQVQLCSLIVTC